MLIYYLKKKKKKKSKDNMNEFVPSTFLINLDSSSFQQELKDFIDYFCKIKAENI